MNPFRSAAAFAVACALVLSLSGCLGGQAATVAEEDAPAAGSEAQTVQPAETDGEAVEASATTGVQIGGSETTGEAWPDDWPAELPRVGGEIWAASADNDEGTFSVVALVDEGVIPSLINEFKAQGYTAENDSSSGDEYGVTLSNPRWRVDIIGVINQESGKPHLRYLAQRE